MDSDTLLVYAAVGVGLLVLLAFLVFLLWVVVRVVKHAWKGSGANVTEVEMRLDGVEEGVRYLTETVKWQTEKLRELERRLLR